MRLHPLHTSSRSVARTKSPVVVVVIVVVKIYLYKRQNNFPSGVQAREFFVQFRMYEYAFQKQAQLEFLQHGQIEFFI